MPQMSLPQKERREYCQSARFKETVPLHISHWATNSFDSGCTSPAYWKLVTHTHRCWQDRSASAPSERAEHKMYTKTTIPTRRRNASHREAFAMFINSQEPAYARKRKQKAKAAFSPSATCAVHTLISSRGEGELLRAPAGGGNPLGCCATVLCALDSNVLCNNCLPYGSVSAGADRR